MTPNLAALFFEVDDPTESGEFPPYPCPCPCPLLLPSPPAPDSLIKIACAIVVEPGEVPYTCDCD